MNDNFKTVIIDRNNTDNSYSFENLGGKLFQIILQDYDTKTIYSTSVIDGVKTIQVLPPHFYGAPYDTLNFISDVESDFYTSNICTKMKLKGKGILSLDTNDNILTIKTMNVDPRAVYQDE